MNKREMIERALKPFLGRESIVIECEVEQDASGLDEVPFTFIRLSRYVKGHHGTPGKALAIIISLEEGNDLAI